eukprot:9781413-Alexandrium_andersonii.AAC.1
MLVWVLFQTQCVCRVCGVCGFCVAAPLLVRAWAFAVRPGWLLFAAAAKWPGWLRGCAAAVRLCMLFLPRLRGGILTRFTTA